MIDPNDIRLERCKRTDPRYRDIRSRHYVPNAGACGRQLHYIIFYRENLAGIISGGSSAFGGAHRDDFFRFDLVRAFDEYYADEHEGNDLSLRSELLVTIINNTVFRLEMHEYGLASAVLKLWRARVTEDWLEEYGNFVIGFETYIVEHAKRVGFCYQMDHWTPVGKTVSGKLIFCKRNIPWEEGDDVLIPWEVAMLMEEMAGKK